MTFAMAPRAVKTQLDSSRQPAGRWLLRLSLLFILLGLGSWLNTIKERWYVFNPESLHALAKDAVALYPGDSDATMAHILANLSDTYDPAAGSGARAVRLNIDPTAPATSHHDASKWVLSSAGGAMGAMYIIHASVTEYLIFFGTPLGTEGHSGLHTADDYFPVLTSEQWAFKAGSVETNMLRPGDQHLLPRLRGIQYKFHESGWALEYARGWTPLMMPFGLLDSLTSTLDLPTFFNTVRIAGWQITRNLLAGKI